MSGAAAFRHSPQPKCTCQPSNHHSKRHCTNRLVPPLSPAVVIISFELVNIGLGDIASKIAQCQMQMRLNAEEISRFRAQIQQYESQNNTLESQCNELRKKKETLEQSRETARQFRGKRFCPNGEQICQLGPRGNESSCAIGYSTCPIRQHGRRTCLCPRLRHFQLPGAESRTEPAIPPVPQLSPAQNHRSFKRRRITHRPHSTPDDPHYFCAFNDRTRPARPSAASASASVSSASASTTKRATEPIRAPQPSRIGRDPTRGLR